jgi:hypothetical protein
MILSIAVTEQEHHELSLRAKQLGLPAEELVRLLLKDMISTEDPTFLEVKKRLLEKNDELYKRLS